MSNTNPDPVDLHVGHRLRQRRVTMGLSQTEIGDALGLSFQQVQKYERGMNRVSASKLWSIAGVLKVTPSYFFEGLASGFSEPAPVDEVSRSVLTITRHFRRLPAPLQVKASEIIRIMADAASPETQAAE